MERGETTTGVDLEGTMKCRGSVGNRVVISQLVLPLRSMDRVIFRLVLSPPPPPRLSSHPPPARSLFPLSVSIEGELAPCLEPSGYLFNIVSARFERSMTRTGFERVERTARFLSRKA